MATSRGSGAHWASRPATSGPSAKPVVIATTARLAAAWSAAPGPETRELTQPGRAAAEHRAGADARQQASQEQQLGAPAGRRDQRHARRQ